MKNTMSQEKKYDVFISYSRKDSAIADEICKAFDRVGITYFIDRKGIGGGNEFPLELATSILNSQIFLLLGSKNSYESKYTNAEIHFAFKKKQQKSILPYILDDTPMPLEIDFILSTINWRKYQEHPINTVLVDDVLKLLGRERPTELVRKDDDIEQAKREALPDGAFQVGDLKYMASENSSGVTVWGLVNEDTTEIRIPSQIKYGKYTYEVTNIGRMAFAYCFCLTSITIPSSVTSIGDKAFSLCEGLTSITIPNSVTSIGDEAFCRCKNLASITIPNSVTSIGDYAFWECFCLTSVTIPDSVTSIGKGAFAWCKGLTSIVVEKGNITYDSRENCNAIIETATNTLIRGCNSTIIPNSVRSIGDYAFSYCSGLTSITIPNSVTEINARSFEGCKGLTSITIPSSVTSIGSTAFWDCSALKSVKIPKSLTEIGEDAFPEHTKVIRE